MSSGEETCDDIRQEIITALDNGKWEFTKRALREGLDAFRSHSAKPLDEEIIDYIRDRLDQGFPLQRVELHDPPFGTACEMINVDSC